MTNIVAITQYIMYIVAILGIGVAFIGIYSVVRAFLKKQDRLYQQKYDEFQEQKRRVEKHLRDTRPA